ncbi:TspO/MBR family protein [Piscirickettsiaceae bacterium NZ-RLO1]|nr:TspO/MBR family protein [Piscirickettsiaceae bacterium NZ-RLO1]
MGQIIQGSVNIWYESLIKSTLTPPNYIFGIAWSILYLLIAISGWIIWRAKKTPRINIIRKSFIVQAFLNWSWTPLFFYYHLILSSFVCLVFISVFSLHVILKSIRTLPVVALLFIPYFLWLAYATYLSYQMWLLN